MHTSHTEHTVLDIFNVCNNHTMFNYIEQESKQQFAVDGGSDTPVTLKQGQVHQTWYKLVDSKQGCVHAKFGKLRLNKVSKKANVKVFVKSGAMSIISLEYVRKSKIVVYTWSSWCT